MSSNGMHVESSKSYFGDAYHWVEPKVRSYSKKATETIKAHPFAAIAVAAGLGYLAVRIWRR